MQIQEKRYLRLAWKTPLGWLKTASVTLPDASIWKSTLKPGKSLTSNDNSFRGTSPPSAVLNELKNY
jgi:hypothetical protein